MAIRVIYYRLSCEVQITLECYERQRYQRNAYLSVSPDHPKQLFQAHPWTYIATCPFIWVQIHAVKSLCTHTYKCAICPLSFVVHLG